MTRSSVKEYVKAIQERYKRAGRNEKGRILDEFIQVTGYHRKAAIRLLGRETRPPASRRGRRRQYGQEVALALEVVWEAADHLCSRRLHPFLSELVSVLERQGHLKVTSMVMVKDQLLGMSASTIDRLLRPYSCMGRRFPFSTTKLGSMLKKSIPIRTFADRDEGVPGFMEVDLAAHCGESTAGFYLNTLCAVDIATGWVECQEVWVGLRPRADSGTLPPPSPVPGKCGIPGSWRPPRTPMPSPGHLPCE